MLLILFNFLNIQNKRSQKSGRNFLSLKTNSDRFESIVTFIYETKINDIIHKIIRTNFKYWEHTF